jgi:uncharacterized protein
VKAEALDLLACPTCRAELQFDGSVPIGGHVRTGMLRCAACETEYPIESGAPRLLPPGAPADRWDEWVEKQALGLREYEELEASAASEPFDRVAAEFGAFCDLNGTILDVGCGIAAAPPYAIRPLDSIYVGVDPLHGGNERTFDFVEAVGERLPFHASVFDIAVAATSLDHFAAPEIVLGEIRRVLKPSGRLAIWIGVLDVKYFERMHAMPSLSDPAARRELVERLRSADFRRLAVAAWSHLIVNRIRSFSLRLRRLLGRRLPVAQVFQDRGRYHFHFYTEREVYDLLEESGFRVTEKRMLKDASSGDSLFVLASPTEAGAT